MPFPICESVKSQTYQTHARFQVTPAKCLTNIGTIAGLLALVLPGAPAMAFYGFSNNEVGRGDYERCTANLTGAKITSEEAASACARAFRPDDLGKCVRRTSQQDSALTTADVLSACREVRRPVDLSECVSEIKDRFGDASTLVVLDNCRRSLLPKRYSDCVVGVSQSTQLTSAAILETCISANDTDRGIDPTFIRYTTNPGAVSPVPAGEATPLAPSSDPTTSPAAPTPSTSPATPTTP